MAEAQDQIGDLTLERARAMRDGGCDGPLFTAFVKRCMDEIDANHDGITRDEFDKFVHNLNTKFGFEEKDMPTSS